MATLYTKDGQRVLTLNDYGYEWGMTYVNGGCDEANIDLGTSDAIDDFFTYLEKESDLTKESIEQLREEWGQDKNWMVEAEDGAREALEENGYKEVSKLYFVKEEA